MTPDLIAQHEFDNGETIVLQAQPHGGDYALIGAFGKLEVPIHFDRVTIQRNQISLSRECPSGPPNVRVSSGALEGGPEDYGAVGDALQRIAGEIPPSELEAMLDA